jgi:replicative superfamily II helicase
MVDFSKRLIAKRVEKKTNPIEIYETLDRASDKGPLRDSQKDVLSNWYSEFRDAKDVILKLHTGQGKTLIGLLILQSKINSDSGPCLYLCPDRYLVEQTLVQAEQFGIKACKIDDDLPSDFLDGRSILVATVNRLFNGITKFKLGARSIPVGTIVLDDAHSCLQKIRESFIIRLSNKSQSYSDIFSLFSESLRDQGQGTYAEIKTKEATSFLPVPYWDWQEKHSEVSQLLAKYSSTDELKYIWPLMKDRLRDCLCIVSGTHIEITPYSIPLELFGSYEKASQRVFMSATINDDSFFIKGLGVKPEAVVKPLRYSKEKWSGEKMVLIPSMIDDSLTRETVINKIAVPAPGRDYGVVAVVPSFERAKLWDTCGARVSKKDTIKSDIELLKRKNGEKVIVFANRYDGIDLADNACRILIIDSKPFGEELYDRYLEVCRGSSQVIETRISQTIEQGMGRHIRGEKDFGVVVLIGSNLIRSMRSSRDRRFFSKQTRHQIELGIDTATLAKEDIKNGKDPYTAFFEIAMQCVNRDPAWKDFYVESMNAMPTESTPSAILNVFVAEKRADDLLGAGRPKEAIKILQDLLDSNSFSDEERGWYLQEMARFAFGFSKIESNKLQVAAHSKNGALLKPKEGMIIQQLSPHQQQRAKAIATWMVEQGTSAEMVLEVDRILQGLQFGVNAEKFEQSVDDLGRMLGFTTERPDRKWKAGPDNLWCVNDREYILIECKNEVNVSRVEIHKEESGQMNNATAWFKENYVGCKVVPVMITPARELGSGAGFNEIVRLMRDRKLSSLASSVRKFIREFSSSDLTNLSESRVESAITTHKLGVADLINQYTDPIKSKLS